jgi:hypothetical protein
MYAPLQTKNELQAAPTFVFCPKIWAKHGKFDGIPGKKLMFFSGMRRIANRPAREKLKGGPTCFGCLLRACGECGKGWRQTRPDSGLIPIAEIPDSSMGIPKDEGL